jgi:hypothetical protein
MLVMPIVVEDPYFLRILVLTSIFAIFAASWDLLSGFTGQINFGHALFFGVGAYGSAILNQQRAASLVDDSPWRHCRRRGRIDCRHSLPAVARHLPGADHIGLSDHPDRHCLRFPGSPAANWDVRSVAPLLITDGDLLYRDRHHAPVVRNHVEDHRLQDRDHFSRHSRG